MRLCFYGIGVALLGNMRLADFLSRSRSWCICGSVGLAAACAESRHHAVTDQVLIASLRTADFATRDLAAGNTSLANVWSAATAAALTAAPPSVRESDDDDRRRPSTASRDTAQSSPRVNASANVVTPPSSTAVAGSDGAGRATEIDGGAGASSGSAESPASPAALPSPPPPAPLQTASPDGDASPPTGPQAWPGPGPFIFVPTFPVPTPAPSASPEGGSP